jgi:hypothetical protein
MDKTWLHRYVAVAAAGALILLLCSAIFAPDTNAYRIVLGLVAVLAAAPLRSRFGYWILAACAIDGVLSVLYISNQRLFGIIHSCVVSSIVSLSVANALRVLDSSSKDVVVLEDAGRPSLRSLSVFAGYSLAAQILLGASLRREALPVIPHILGAMLVAAVVLYLVMAVFMQYSSYRELKTPSILLTGLIGAQVLLGIGALLNKAGQPVLAMPPRFFSAAHIVTGSLTMAMTVVLAMRISRHTCPVMAVNA